MQTVSNSKQYTLKHCKRFRNVSVILPLTSGPREATGSILYPLGRLGGLRNKTFVF